MQSVKYTLVSDRTHELQDICDFETTRVVQDMAHPWAPYRDTAGIVRQACLQMEQAVVKLIPIKVMEINAI